MGTSELTEDRNALFEKIHQRADCREIFREFWPEHFVENGNSHCPFHEDEKPSLQVSRELAYCHAEGLKLDAVDLYERGAGVSRSEAVSALIKRYGVADSAEPGLADFALMFEHLRKTPLSEEVKAYLSQRGLSSIAQSAWDAGLLASKGEVLIAPVKRLDGNVIGWQIISPGGGKRFTNGTKAGDGFYLFPGNGSVVVCEGVIDALSVKAALPDANVCALLSASMCRKVADLRGRSEAPILFFDNDEAGRKATDKAVEVLNGWARVVDWNKAPAGFTDKDVNDLLVRGHSDIIKEMIETAERCQSNPATMSRVATMSNGAKIVDLDAFRASRFLKGTPRQIEWLLKDSLPLGSIGILVADGGIGKSHLLLQLGFAVAGNIPFLNDQYEIGTHGKAFLIFGEDPDDVLTHRTRKAIHSLVPHEARSAFEQSMDQNLFIRSIKGEDFRLSKMINHGNLEATQAFSDLLEDLKQVPDLKLVALDPVSRFFGGDENNSSHATHFCSLLERIANETGATVVFSQHISKAAANNSGLKGLHQGAARGSTGFTNAARWQLQLVTPSNDDAKKHGLDQNNLNSYLGARVVKKNVGPPEDVFFLRRDHNGILLLFDTPVSPGSEDDQVVAAIVDKVSELEAAGLRNSYTADTLVRKFAGVWEGFGKTKLERAVQKALAEGKISLVKSKNKSGREVKYLGVASSEALDDDDGHCPVPLSIVK